MYLREAHLRGPGNQCSPNLSAVSGNVYLGDMITKDQPKVSIGGGGKGMVVASGLRRLRISRGRLVGEGVLGVRLRSDCEIGVYDFLLKVRDFSPTILHVSTQPRLAVVSDLAAACHTLM